MLFLCNKNYALQGLALAGRSYLCYNCILTTGESVKTQQIYDYVQAVKYQSECEIIVDTALRTLNPDNCIMGTAQPLQNAYTKLVRELLTTTQFDWLMWYMYESDYGQRSMGFSINNEWFDVQGMSFFKFWEIVNAV